MPDSNGKQKWSDIAHRIGIWGAVVAIAVKLFSVGAWVGAADEKFADAETVETKQDDLILQVNTLATVAKATTKAVEDNKTAIETSRTEILEAIRRTQ